jgi:lysozyme
MAVDTFGLENKSMMQGIDVSNYQGNPNWQQVAASGCQFVITKATEGIGFTDPTFAANWPGIKAAGMVRGAYHFARPDLGNTPEAEASYFLEVIQAQGLQTGDFLALDLEVGNTNLVGWTLTWLEQVTTAVGFQPLFYASLSFLSDYGFTNNPSMAQYGLWLADYTSAMPATPPTWPVIAIWQYSNAGSIPGINGNCDQDVFNGTLDELKQYGKPA